MALYMLHVPGLRGIWCHYSLLSMSSLGIQGFKYVSMCTLPEVWMRILMYKCRDIIGIFQGIFWNTDGKTFMAPLCSLSHIFITWPTWSTSSHLPVDVVSTWLSYMPRSFQLGALKLCLLFPHLHQLSAQVFHLRINGQVDEHTRGCWILPKDAAVHRFLSGGLFRCANVVRKSCKQTSWTRASLLSSESLRSSVTLCRSWSTWT